MASVSFLTSLTHETRATCITPFINRVIVTCVHHDCVTAVRVSSRCSSSLRTRLLQRLMMHVSRPILLEEKQICCTMYTAYWSQRFSFNETRSVVFVYRSNRCALLRFHSAITISLCRHHICITLDSRMQDLRRQTLTLSSH